jgi:hypothetical protein
MNMQLKDVTPIIKAILEERDKIPRIIDKERYIPNPQPYHDGDCMRGGIRKALRIIEQAPVVDATPRWISVEERLPEDDANVLVYAIGNNENSCIAMTSYTHNLHGFHIEGWRSPWQYFFDDHKITHWMPLPPAPKEESPC